MTGRIQQQIERFAPGFGDLILATSVRAPAALELDNPNLVGGDINGGVLDLRQLWARPTWRAYSTPRRDLFLCSASTPPGGGVHGLCGFFAARAALSQASLRARDGVYRLVIVRLPFANGDVQVLDVTAKLPAMVDVEAVVTVMVPPIWPAHAGAAGMLPGPTEIVYGNTAPLILPVKNPFSSTMPLASVTNTGPETELSACCASIHLICAWPPCALRSPIHVPVTLT